MCDWVFNGIRTNPSEINQYRKIAIPTLMGFAIIEEISRKIAEDKRWFAKLDKIIPVSKSNAINVNLFSQSFLSSQLITGSYMGDHYLKSMFKNLVFFVTFKSFGKASPNGALKSLDFVLNTIVLPIFSRLSSAVPKRVDQAVLKDFISNKFEQEMNSGFIPTFQELWKDSNNFNLCILGIIGLLYAKMLCGTFNKVYQRRIGLKKARLQLHRLKKMLLCAQKCERLFFGQDQEFQKLTHCHKEAWKELNSPTFASSQKAEFFNYGKVISLYKYLTTGLEFSKDQRLSFGSEKVTLLELNPLLERIAEIDLCVAITKLVLKTKGQGNQFCLAEFVDRTTAGIKAEQLWHPLCTREKAICNNISLGSLGKPEDSGPCFGQIVTGGNSTGKSIYTSSALLAAYLAQCICVGPAQELMLTPFDKFITQINTQDDPIKGKSLFRVQIRQIGQLAAEIESLATAGQKVIIGLDESLSGTPWEYAQALLGAIFAICLAHNTNYILFFATHLKKLAKEALKLTHGKLAPTYILCNLDPEGHFKDSTFKVAQGTSSVDSALTVAQEEWSEFFSQEKTEKLVGQAKMLFTTIPG